MEEDVTQIIGNMRQIIQGACQVVIDGPWQWNGKGHGMVWLRRRTAPSWHAVELIAYDSLSIRLGKMCDAHQLRLSGGLVEVPSSPCFGNWEEANKS